MGNKLSDLDIDSVIKTKAFVRVSDRTTLCVLTLKNGYEVLGESSCVDVANYSQQKGEHYAYESARSKIWQLEGYKLRDAMYAAQGVQGAADGEPDSAVGNEGTEKLDDVVLMLHKLADSIEAGSIPVVRAVVVTDSGAINAGPAVYGFGESVGDAAVDMLDGAQEWFAAQRRAVKASKTGQVIS